MHGVRALIFAVALTGADALLGGLLRGRGRRVVDYTAVTLPAPAAGPPAQEVTVVDLMPFIRERIASTRLRDGSVNVISRHTTTAVTINEWESRLVRDVRAWLLRSATPKNKRPALVQRTKCLARSCCEIPPLYRCFCV